MFTTLLAIAFLGGCLGMPTTSDIPESTTTEAIGELISIAITFYLK